jgi:hypothetical protein
VRHRLVREILKAFDEYHRRESEAAAEAQAANGLRPGNGGEAPPRAEPAS